jgi:hypothetical protein
MLHSVKLENITCEVCSKPSADIICFWFDTKQEKDDYFRDITGEKKSDKEILEVGAIDGEKEFSTRRWVGYMKHSVPGPKRTICCMTGRAPKSKELLALLALEIEKEKNGYKRAFNEHPPTPPRAPSKKQKKHRIRTGPTNVMDFFVFAAGEAKNFLNKERTSE